MTSLRTFQEAEGPLAAHPSAFIFPYQSPSCQGDAQNTRVQCSVKRSVGIPSMSHSPTMVPQKVPLQHCAKYTIDIPYSQTILMLSLITLKIFSRIYLYISNNDKLFNEEQG